MYNCLFIYLIYLSETNSLPVWLTVCAAVEDNKFISSVCNCQVFPSLNIMSPFHNLGTSFWSWHKDNQREISEFTQQDCRKKRTAKCLCVTNMTDLLLFCGDLHSSLCFLVFYKMTCLKEGEVRRKSFSNKILSHLSNKVFCLLSSPILLRKLTIVWRRHERVPESAKTCCHQWLVHCCSTEHFSPVKTKLSALRLDGLSFAGCFANFVHSFTLLYDNLSKISWW